MGSLVTIAARDIKSYFSSPKGVLIFWALLFLMGFFFHNFVATFVEMQQRAPMYGGEAPTLEQLLRALFYNLHFVLILIIPAVTMASFSEEKRSQSIRMLLTSPVSATQIVLAKFFAAATIMALVLLGSFVYPMFTMAFGNPDFGVIASAYLGLFLLICSQLAFGLWISSMTSSQFMAFIFTMFGLFFLLILNWLAPNIAGGGLFEEVIKYVASSDHLDAFFKGMLTVKDVTYFLCFTAMFLFFTNVVLDSQRWR
jgi:ABC-2 type transport system permease protein